MFNVLQPEESLVGKGNGVDRGMRRREGDVLCGAGSQMVKPNDRICAHAYRKAYERECMCKFVYLCMCVSDLVV